MKGKDKCKILKDIRAQIAAANDIEWVTENCSHKGDCRGTCPKCESEVAALEKALARRKALGKTVAVAGLSAGLIVSSSACALKEVNELNGDMAAPKDQVKATSEQEATSPLTGDMCAVDVTDVTTTDLIDGEMVEFAGVPIPYYYYTDFVLQDAVWYQADADFYANSVIMEGESDYFDGTTIPAGALFEVVGAMDNGYMYLIRYEGTYYAIYDSDLPFYAHEVTAPEMTDAPEVTD